MFAPMQSGKPRYSEAATINRREKNYRKWLSKAIEKHGRFFSYDAAQEMFKTQKSPEITIDCSEHGNFLITPHDHLRYQSGGCEKCASKSRSGHSKISQRSDVECLQELLEISKLHDRFKVKNATTIECIKHQWLSTVENPKNTRKLTQNHTNCPECAEEKFQVEKTRLIAKNKWSKNYRFVDQKVSKNGKVTYTITCSIHGDFTYGKDARYEHYTKICKGCHDLECRQPSIINSQLFLNWYRSTDNPVEHKDLPENTQKTKVHFYCGNCETNFSLTPYKFRKRLLDDNIEEKCPNCVKISKSLASKYPELVKFWDHETNQIEPRWVIASDTKTKFSWLCTKHPEHRYLQSVGTKVRSKSENCDICASLGYKHPELLDEWDFDKNTIDPMHVAAGSDLEVHWICRINKSHKWPGRVANRTNADRTGGCPYCSGYLVDNTNNLASMRPKIAKLWDHEKNGNLKPEDVYWRSTQRVHWKCNEGPDHEWEGSIMDRVSSEGCIYCVNQRVSITNCLSTKFPSIAEEWHPTKNGSLTPEKVLAVSGQNAFWQCRYNKDHYWKVPVAARTSTGTNCPHCHIAPRSRIELRITAELKIFFPELEAIPASLNLDGKKLMPDIIIKSRNLIIEYDGEYFHRDKFEKDQLKNLVLEAAGWFVLRLREIPLDPLEPSIPFDPKNFKHSMDQLILELSRLDYISATEANTYITAPEPTNTDLFERWLEIALTEKAIFSSPRTNKKNGSK